MSLADLHTHTTFSDGRLSPPGLVEKAALRGLAALAVTDHDTVAGFELARSAAGRHGIVVISGVELSADFEGQDVHVLGYGFDPSHDRLRTHLADFRVGRMRRAREMVGLLREVGAPISWDRVIQLAAGGVVARPHIGQALVEAGHAATIAEAFDRLIGDRGPAYVQKPAMEPHRVMDLVHGAGGVCVLAHPGDRISPHQLLLLKRAGLDGIETVHPSHDDLLREYWEDLAERHGLFTTGGSDYHGYRPEEEVRFGQFGVPVESLGWLEGCWQAEILSGVAGLGGA